MVGITLSPEQIHQAPPEVRRWIEQQIAGALGLSRPAPVMEPPARHLVGLDLDQARAVLALIDGRLPVVSVFFELAQEPIGVTQQGLRVLRLDDIQRRCRLQGLNQVVVCLGAIDEALRRALGAADVVLTMVDGSGHCLVVDETAQSILALWREIVTAHQGLRPSAPASVAQDAAAQPAFEAPYSIPMPQPAVDGHPGAATQSMIA